MIIIGEKINGAIPSVAKAIEDKDEAHIKSLAESQAEAGAAFIDVCASTDVEIELDTMKWLIDLVQDTTRYSHCRRQPDARSAPNHQILQPAGPG